MEKTLLDGRICKLYTINEFENGIKKGLFSDSKGEAVLIVGGKELPNTYTLHIDRRVVSKQGQIVSFYYLLKEYTEEGIRIGYIEKKPPLPSLDDYLFYKEQRSKRNNL